jgi:glycine cleavage system regulatory protein
MQDEHDAEAGDFPGSTWRDTASRPHSAELEYVRIDELALWDRVAPLFPSTSVEEDTGTDTSSYPALVQAISTRITEESDSIIDRLIDLMVAAFGDRFAKQRAATKNQLKILQDLLNLADIMTPAFEFDREFVWGDCAESAALALLDGLVTLPARQLTTPRTWADHTLAVIDVPSFVDAAGISKEEVDEILLVAATIAHQHIMALLQAAFDNGEPTILRYRDRWIALQGFSAGGLTAFDIEPLRPIMALGELQGTDSKSACLFGEVEIFQTTNGLRFTFPSKSPAGISVECLLQADFNAADLRFEGGVLHLPIDGELRVNETSVEALTVDGSLLLLEYLEKPFGIESGADEHSADAPPTKSSQYHALVTYFCHDEPGVFLSLMEHFHRRHISVASAADAKLGSNAAISLLLSLSTSIDEAALARLVQPDEGDACQEVIRDQWVTGRVNKVETPTTETDSASLWNVSFRGPDSIGLLSAVIAVLARHAKAVRRCYAATRPIDPQSLFDVEMTVELPAGGSPVALKKSLQALFLNPYQIRVESVGSVLDYWSDLPDPSPKVDETSVLVTIGDAKAAGLQYVTRRIHEMGFNVVGASTVVLGDHWAGVFALSASGLDTRGDDAAKQAMKGIDKDRFGLAEVAAFGAGAPSPERMGRTQRYDLRFDSSNEKGSLIAPLASLARIRCNVESVYAHVEDRVSPSVGAFRFALATDPGVPPQEIANALELLSDQEGWLSYRLCAFDSPVVVKGKGWGYGSSVSLSTTGGSP